MYITFTIQDNEDFQSRKRARTTFNSDQVKEMEKIFSVTHYPDVQMREQLCRKTGLPESRIQVNCQYRYMLFLQGERCKSHLRRKTHKLSCRKIVPNFCDHFFLPDLVSKPKSEVVLRAEGIQVNPLMRGEGHWLRD